MLASSTVFIRFPQSRIARALLVALIVYVTMYVAMRATRLVFFDRGRLDRVRLGSQVFYGDVIVQSRAESRLPAALLAPVRRFFGVAAATEWGLRRIGFLTLPGAAAAILLLALLLLRRPRAMRQSLYLTFVGVSVASAVLLLIGAYLKRDLL